MGQRLAWRPAGSGGQRLVTSALVGEGQLRLLLDSVQDCGIVMVSRTGMILTWNAAAEQINGYTPGEVIGQHMSVLYPDEDVAEGRPRRELECARSRGVHRTEGWRVRKDGRRVWVSHVITALHDRTGRLRGFGTATRVLSDRMRAEDLLAVLDAVPDAVLGIDGDGRILLANVGAQRLFGVGGRGLLGRPVESLLPDRFRDLHTAHRAGYVAAVHSRAMTQRPQVPAVRADGSEFAAEVRLSSVHTPRGPIVTALVRELPDPG